MIPPLKFTEILRQLQLQEFHYLGVEKVLLASSHWLEKAREDITGKMLTNNHVRGHVRGQQVKPPACWHLLLPWSIWDFSSRSHAGDEASQEAVKTKRLSPATKRSSSAVQNTHKIHQTPCPNPTFPAAFIGRSPVHAWWSGATPTISVPSPPHWAPDRHQQLGKFPDQGWKWGTHPYLLHVLNI